MLSALRKALKWTNVHSRLRHNNLFIAMFNCWIDWNSAANFSHRVWTFARFVRPLLATILCIMGNLVPVCTCNLSRISLLTDPAIYAFVTQKPITKARDLIPNRMLSFVISRSPNCCTAYCRRNSICPWQRRRAWTIIACHLVPCNHRGPIIK